jgi:CHAT domain-containing protein/Tfp pilus assembly protein PilF
MNHLEPNFSKQIRRTAVGVGALGLALVLWCVLCTGTVRAHADPTPTPTADALTAGSVPTATVPTTSAVAPPSLDELLTLSVNDQRFTQLREAAFQVGEGDRHQQAGRIEEARAAWQAAAAAFEAGGDGLGAADAYLRIANSYLPPALGCIMTAVVQPYAGAGQECATRLSLRDRRGLAALSEEDLWRAAGYYLDAILAASDVYETAIQNSLTYDPAVLDRAEESYDRALASFRNGDCAGAAPHLETALRLYRQQDFGAGEVRVLVIQALCRLQARQFLRALPPLLEAFQIAENLPLGTPIDEQYLAAARLYEAGQYAQAADAYREVLALYEAEADAADVAQTKHELGNVHAQMGDYAAAERWFQEAKAEFDQIDNAYSEQNRAAVRHNLGNLAVIQGRYTDAYDLLSEAVQIWQEIGDPANEAASLSSLGLALRGLSRFEDALQVLERAEALQARLPPDPLTAGDIVNNIGYVYHSLGQHRTALAQFERALEVRRRLPPPHRAQKEFETLSNMGAAQAALSRFDAALETYGDVLAYADSAQSPLAAAHVRANMASIHIARGDYQRGLAGYLDALPVFEQSGAQPAAAAILQNMGAAYVQVGELETGQRYLEEALALFQEMGERESVAAIHNNLGLMTARSSMGNRFELAEDHLNAALTIWEQTGNRSAVGRARANLALVRAAQEDWAAALAHGEEALDCFTAAGLPAEAARAHIILSLLHLAQGDSAAAKEHAEEALAAAETVGDPLAELGGHLLLASAYFYVEGDLARADEEIQTAIALLEQSQGALTASQLKSAFLGQLADVYDLAVLIAWAQDDSARAFRHAEQARARAFLDQLGNARIDFRTGADPELLRREQDLRRQQRDLFGLRSAATDAQVAKELTQELEAVQQAHAELLTELQITHPEYAALVSAEVLDLDQVQQTVVPTDTTLIVYLVPDSLPDEPALAWVIDRERTELVELDPEPAEVLRQIEVLQNGINFQDEDVSVNAMLYDNLIAPLEPHIQHENLIIAPHGALHYLPFAALWEAGSERYMVEKYALSYAPSASSLPFIFEKGDENSGRALILGNPDKTLKHAAVEAAAVAELYDTEAITGGLATEAMVHARAAENDVLHLAAHGTYNQINPFFTHIALAADDAHDGYLHVHEMYDLDLSATNLVVLSACDTTDGELTGGDEVVGLPRALLYAGAPTVVASLWPVDDAATAALMEAFHNALRAGETPAAALRAAQIEMLARDEWRSPYYWAAFGVYGDGW